MKRLKFSEAQVAFILRRADECATRPMSAVGADLPKSGRAHGPGRAGSDRLRHRATQWGKRRPGLIGN